MAKKIKRAKYSRKFYLAVWLVAALFICALMGSFPAWGRVVLLLAAAVVGCVWIWCESRIDCAAAPLNLPDDLVPEKKKPPEDKAE